MILEPRCASCFASSSPIPRLAPVMAIVVDFAAAAIFVVFVGRGKEEGQGGSVLVELVILMLLDSVARGTNFKLRILTRLSLPTLHPELQIKREEGAHRQR